jgi:hypothetical protein
MSENEDDLLAFDDFELVEDEQASILHTKNKDDIDYYIEFDVFTREVTEISPVEIIQPRSFRHNIFIKKIDDIIKKVLQSKIPTSRIKAWFNPVTNEHDLVVSNSYKKAFDEYFFVQNQKDIRSPIHLDCNLILKKTTVLFNTDEFKKYISSVAVEEEDIRLAKEIKFYCFEENNPTMLHGGFTVNSDELMEKHSVIIPCHWFPNDHRRFDKYTFIHSGANFNISFGLTEPEAVSDLVILERPQVLYKQQGSTISFQSIMNNVANYKIQDTVNFYCYKKDDPSRLLFKLNVPKNDLDKFNSFSVKLNFDDKIKILSDHAHLYIEDNDVSTYYKF